MSAVFQGKGNNGMHVPSFSRVSLYHPRLEELRNRLDQLSGRIVGAFNHT